MYIKAPLDLVCPFTLGSRRCRAAHRDQLEVAHVIIYLLEEKLKFTVHRKDLFSCWTLTDPECLLAPWGKSSKQLGLIRVFNIGISPVSGVAPWHGLRDISLGGVLLLWHNSEEHCLEWENLI